MSIVSSSLLLLACFAPLVAAYDAISPLNYTDVNDPEFTLMGYTSLPPALVAADDASAVDAFPAVVILPDWDNVNDYEITRAKMISEELGYVAFTADIYGADMHDVQDFQVKVEQATKYRSDPDLFNSRIQSAIGAVKGMPFVDANRVAIIGYCLGGTGVLGYSFSNTVDSNNSMYDIFGGVSFHGGLMDFNVTGAMASPVLVLSGGNDDAGTAVEELEGRLKEANATWQITRYSGVYHGFTKFDSQAYNEWVDSRSWKEMSTFLAERFGEIEYGTKEPSLDTEYALGLVGIDTTDVSRQSMSAPQEGMVMVETVNYDDNGFALEGYLALPPMADGETRPALLILPDWDGVLDTRQNAPSLQPKREDTLPWLPTFMAPNTPTSTTFRHALSFPQSTEITPNSLSVAFRPELMNSWLTHPSIQRVFSWPDIAWAEREPSTMLFHREP